MISRDPAKRPLGRDILTFKCFKLDGKDDTTPTNIIRVEGVGYEMAAENNDTGNPEISSETKTVMQFADYGVVTTGDDADDNELLLAIARGEPKEELEGMVNLGVDWRATNAYGHSVAHRAAETGHLEALKYFMSLGADVTATDVKMESPLHRARFAPNNFQEILKIFLDNSVDINAVDQNGNNLIFLAALCGRPREDLEQIVMEAGDWDIKNVKGQTALHLAALGGNLDAIHYFMSLGATINRESIDNDGRTLFHQICFAASNFIPCFNFLINNDEHRLFNKHDKQGHQMVHTAALNGRSEREMDEILKHCRGYWKTSNQYGLNVLHLATEGGNVDTLKYLISRGADRNGKDLQDRTMLHAVSKSKRNFSETLKFALEQKFNINAVDKLGNNLVLLAAMNGRSKEELEEILKNGCSWKIKNKTKANVLHLAAQGGNLEALEYFVSLGGDLTSKDMNQETPLHYVSMATKCIPETIDFLVKKNLNINAHDKDGNDLVFLAALRGSSPEHLDQICKQGGQWPGTNNSGQSVLHLAAEGGNLDGLQYFMHLGADVNSMDNDGETPLHAARFAERNFSKIVRELVANGADINATTKSGHTLQRLLETCDDYSQLRFAKLDFLKTFC